MMTKREYANFIVDKFCNENGIERGQLKTSDWGAYMRSSSSLAVALEYLGLLSHEDLWYSRSRGGFGMLHPETHLVISTRDILNMLPDDDDSTAESIYVSNGTVADITKIFRDKNLGNYFVYINEMNKVYLNIDHANKAVIIDEKPL